MLTVTVLCSYWVSESHLHFLVSFTLYGSYPEVKNILCRQGVCCILFCISHTTYWARNDDFITNELLPNRTMDASSVYSVVWISYELGLRVSHVCVWWGSCGLCRISSCSLGRVAAGSDTASSANCWPAALVLVCGSWCLCKAVVASEAVVDASVTVVSAAPADPLTLYFWVNGID